MGTDDLFHKRKRNLASLKRQKNKRESYDVILIICEGAKTERFYFNGLCKEYNLSNANIIIVSGKKTCPSQIVDEAVEKNKINNYDRIYCVFDKDHHVKYKEAVLKVENINKSKKYPPFFAITSVPCFEYWLLLHFELTTRPYIQVQKNRKSSGDQLKSDLRKYIKNYHEGYENAFDETKKNVKTAIKNAKNVEKQQTSTNTDNPTTKVHQLVEYLIHIKSDDLK